MDSLGFHHKTPREKYEYERWEKKWAKWIILAWIAIVIGCMYIGSDKAGAQTNPPPAGFLCHSATQVALDIQTDAPDDVQPQPGDTVTVSWSQFGERTTDHKWIDGSGLCTFDVAFYTHGDNQVLRPHPDSTLIAHTENVLPTVVHTERLGPFVLWQRFQLTFTIPEYDVECTEGTQIDIYKDTVGSDGTWGPGVGPIEDFDTNDDGVIDRRYSDEFRLVAASNWESETELCVPPTTIPEDTTTTSPTTTTTSTTVESTTTTTVPTTTTDPSPTSITTTSVQSPSITSDVTVAPTTVGTAPSSTFGTSGKELAHTGNNGNLIVLGIALVLGGLVITIAGYRRRIF